jgi:hypothetical protein
VIVWLLDLQLPMQSVTITTYARNQGTRRKPPTCRMSLKTLSHNVVLSTPRHDRDSNSQL